MPDTPQNRPRTDTPVEVPLEELLARMGVPAGPMTTPSPPPAPQPAENPPVSLVLDPPTDPRGRVASPPPPAPRIAPPSARRLAEEAKDPYLTPTNEPFRGDDSSRIAILGGKQTGKSYLFQSMVYRCQSGAAAGALAPWLRGQGLRMFTTQDVNGVAHELNRRKFLDYYRRWTRLDQTLAINESWYKLRLGLRSGLLGMSQVRLDVDFFDASGELLEQPVSDLTRPTWAHFAGAQVVVFCLPMWAAFPSWRRNPTREESIDWENRLTGFEQVSLNLREVLGSSRRKIRTVLALTMADDRRVALKSVQQKWIHSVIERPDPHLRKLRSVGGVTRYLDNARRVSDVVLNELVESPWDELKGIPERLDFGAGPPWVIPMSAMDGARLTQVENDYPDALDRPAHLAPPVPAHVELPLLVGLCDRFNALM